MSAAHEPSAAARDRARVLLAGGIVAGPAFVTIGLVEAALRPGFDLTRHSLSLLANGEGGWIHVAMMVATGLLTLAAAVGLRSAPFPYDSPRIGSALIAAYGLAIAVSGVLTADPALGFPPGAPAGPPASVSWHGIGHLVAGSIGFLSLVAATFVFGRWFGRLGERRWATYGRMTGLGLLIAFLAISSGSQLPGVSLLFFVAGSIGWIWLAALCARLSTELGGSHVPSAVEVH